ncbi:hypothetical protein MTR67_051591, partial [Solanum verrucosum]
TVPHKVDNVVTWDRAVILVELMAEHEVDFSGIIILEIYERAFRKTTIMPFPFLIFHLYIEATIPLWHSDKLVESIKTVDVGLIKDDANLTVLSLVDLPPLSADVVVDIEQIGVEHTTDDIIYAPKMEACTQMATLLQHKRPWIYKSVEELEASMEKMMDDKIKAVHKRLDAFELRVLDRPQTRPNIDVTTFQTELDRLQADVHALVATAEASPKPTLEVDADDMVLSSPFGDRMLSLDPPCGRKAHPLF